MDYFRKILENNPGATDFLNAGHTSLAMGQNRDAFTYYSAAVKKFDGSYEKFLDAFSQDIPDLINAGVKATDIPVFIDSLMYGRE
jgi:hypothetical protein